MARSYALTDLAWPEVRAHLARDRRLIVPVGACDQYGPHLPIGASTLLAEALARELAQDFGVLRAPALPYGVNLPSARPRAGSAGVHEKTLHRVINELLTAWEDQGFQEFIVITAHEYRPHGEALAAVITRQARVRVVEALAIDLTELTGPLPPQHGGEVTTSLMLYLHPEKVNLAAAEDFVLPADAAPAAVRRLGRVPDGSPGSVGRPTRATRELGEKIYQYILQRIRSKVFLAAEEDDGEE